MKNNKNEETSKSSRTSEDAYRFGEFPLTTSEGDAVRKIAVEVVVAAFAARDSAATARVAAVDARQKAESWGEQLEKCGATPILNRLGGLNTGQTNG